MAYLDSEIANIFVQYFPDVADKAIDGNRNSNFYSGSCAHNGGGNPVWWMIDLEENITVTNVIITSMDQGRVLKRDK